MLRDFYNSNLSNGTLASVLVQQHRDIYGTGICTHGLSRETMANMLDDLQKQRIREYVQSKKAEVNATVTATE